MKTPTWQTRLLNASPEGGLLEAAAVMWTAAASAAPAHHRRLLGDLQSWPQVQACLLLIGNEVAPPPKQAHRSQWRSHHACCKICISFGWDAHSPWKEG